MTTGIFNPYREEEPVSEVATLTEYGINTKHYQITITLKDPNKSLTEIASNIMRLQREYPDHFLRCGVQVSPRGETYQVEQNEYAAPTDVGYLRVHLSPPIDNDDVTDMVFQRIGYTLYTLNKPAELKNLSVTKRG
jgi:hypothetical protein